MQGREQRRGYMLTYAIAYIRDYLAQYHIISEITETACTDLSHAGELGRGGQAGKNCMNG
ncbi:MAG: hypothetical protein H6667_12020 [Ardenticatenaceae bacterium]|nr:hypothetical protein [Ardenticatenaceae bacterium]